MHSHRLAGRLAKAAGDSFEAWVDNQHQVAQQLGILVHIQHNQPQVRHVGGRLIYTARSGTDWTGLLADGRSLAVEAKSTRGRLARSTIKPKQAEQLDAVMKVGGLSYLMVEFRKGLHQNRFAIPWRHVPWIRKRSAESIGIENVSEIWEVESDCYLRREING